MSNFANIPKHIAIIPDGNRRWARERGLPVFEGHRISAEKTLPKLIKKSQEVGIKYFTFWALSRENLKNRTKEEVDALINLMRNFLKTKTKDLHEKNIKIKIIGNLSKLPEDIQKNIKKAEELTKNNSGLIVIFAINYGGRDEILRAISKIQNQKSEIRNLSEKNFNQFLDTKDLPYPNPDLVIRTSGEVRTSGFMIWQTAYSEWIFYPKYFPDFSPEDLEKCIEEYSKRQRRFGR